MPNQGWTPRATLEEWYDYVKDTLPDDPDIHGLMKSAFVAGMTGGICISVDTDAGRNSQSRQCLTLANELRRDNERRNRNTGNDKT